jgi:hypothetical protein
MPMACPDGHVYSREARAKFFYFVSNRFDDTNISFIIRYRHGKTWLPETVVR